MNSIFSALLDLQFTKMVTPRLAPVVYLICVSMSAIMSLGMMVRLGFWGLIVGVLGFISSVIMTRVLIEVALAIFQIAKYSQETARQGRSRNIPIEPVAAELPVPPRG